MKSPRNTTALVRFICAGYSRSYLQRRNEWRSGHTARVISIYNDESGGTHNPLAYAATKEIHIVNCLG